MNNTEIHRTDLDRQLAVELGDSWRTLLAGAALIILWVSFRPFQGGQPVLYQGSLLNQLGYTATTGLLLLTLVTSVRPAIQTISNAQPGEASRSRMAGRTLVTSVRRSRPVVVRHRVAQRFPSSPW
ncbi:MAG: hypothetical protein AAFR13_02550 [Pseudomonadota bacterium]